MCIKNQSIFSKLCNKKMLTSHQTYIIYFFAKQLLLIYAYTISAILKNADLEKTSSKKVRLELERIFKCDFTARKKEIDTMVMDYVDSTQNDEESEKSSEEEEEPQPQKKKPAPPPPKKAAKKRKANSDSDASSNNDDSGDDYKPERRAAAKKPKKADSGTKKAKGTGRKGKCMANKQTKE